MDHELPGLAWSLDMACSSFLFGWFILIFSFRFPLKHPRSLAWTRSPYYAFLWYPVLFLHSKQHIVIVCPRPVFLCWTKSSLKTKKLPSFPLCFSCPCVKWGETIASLIGWLLRLNAVIPINAYHGTWHIVSAECLLSLLIVAAVVSVLILIEAVEVVGAVVATSAVPS